jgi:NADH-ubiquinone oxidoreductase chain 5
MYLSILFLPLLGSLVSGLLGRKIGVTGSHIITCSSLGLTSVMATIAFYEVGICGSPVSIYLTSWIDSELMSVSWGFLFDSLTVSMLIPVLFVSTLVHIYSISYMGEDPHNQRFFSYLSLFTFFMLVLVAGDSYLTMFIGWEGIGISSYLLINFWFTRIQANKSAILALTMNRVGDMFLSIGFFAIFWLFGNIDYATVFSIAPYMNETAITIIGLLLLFAAMGKSAQLGLNTWLPHSMEGWRFFTKQNLIFPPIIDVDLPRVGNRRFPTLVSKAYLGKSTIIGSPPRGNSITISPTGDQRARRGYVYHYFMFN